MMRLLAFLFLAFLSTSCVSYQYIKMESDLPVEEDTQRYHKEWDELKMSYEFWGENLPVTTRIYNMGDSMLYVDLASSTFTLNGRVVKNAISPKRVNFRSISDEWEFGELDLEFTRGVADIPPNKDFIAIPPGAYAAVRIYPYRVVYDPGKKHFYTDIDTLEVGSVRRLKKRYVFGENERELGVNFSIGTKRDFSDSKSYSASFNEAYLYNSSDYTPLLPTAQYYYVSKRHRGGALLLLLGMVTILAVAADEAEE